VRPLRDHILVKPDPILNHISNTKIVVSARTGINAPKEQLGRTGTVVAVGSCRMRWEDRNGRQRYKYRQQVPEVRVGDRILFGEYEYPEVPSDGPDRLLVLSEADVVGVIE
jgi:co-chaperonin GroES (HSP10)